MMSCNLQKKITYPFPSCHTRHNAPKDITNFYPSQPETSQGLLLTRVVSSEIYSNLSGNLLNNFFTL